MSKKLFAFDIDGTLLNDDKNVLDSTKKAISKLLENNHVVCLSTGRTPIQTCDIVSELNLKHFIIGSGGACYHDLSKNKTTILAEEIDKKDLEIMWNTAQELKREINFNNGSKYWRVYFGKDLLSEVKDPKYFIGGTSKKPIYDDKDEAFKALMNEKIIQISIKVESDKIETVKNLIHNKFSDDIHFHITSQVYFEISKNNINKSNAIQKIQKLYDISDEDVYCFGDSDNDYEMIKNCKNGIAMGNATPKIKNIAKKIIKNNNDNAIFDFLREQKLI